MSAKNTYNVIILGAGAAGLMCAVTAGQRGRSVLVLERNKSVGKKIRISGGGRCNFTNIHTNADRYLSQNPHFAKSALAGYTPQDFIDLVNKHKIHFHEKKLGQLFCDDSAQQIIDMLLKECRDVSATIQTNINVQKIRHQDLFCVETSEGIFQAESLVIATGGLSIPPLGATDFGYSIAKQFGLRIVTCRPGLVPLKCSGTDLHMMRSLSGIAIPAVASFAKNKFEENILFTHRGLSGPAVLQISSYWQPQKALQFDLLPKYDWLTWIKTPSKKKTTLKNYLATLLPNRFAEAITQAYFSDKPINQLSLKERQAICEKLSQWKITPTGTEGYAKAEVTVGGVDTQELSSKTMEAKKVRGLYFIGEVVDVTGHLGGYNFQWAWSSGFAAGNHA